MKKLLSMLLTLAMLVPTFGALPSFAAEDNNTETKYVAAVYKPDGTFYDNYDSASKAMVNAVDFDGTVKLLADSTEDTPVSVIGGTHATLDLNGYTLRRNNENNMSDKIGYVVDVGESGTLTIDDSSEAKTGTIRGGGAKYGGGIYAEKNSVVTMNAGNIYRCYGYYGGGVYLCDNAQFIMNGGKINKCYGHYGGGVYVEDNAVFTTNGGEISECIAEADGGGVYVWNAKAELNYCYIAKNQAKNGGGVYSDYSMSDEYSILRINNSSVVYNKATGNYGGVYAKGHLALRSYTTISGNVNYGEYGGGVYSQNDSIELSGSVYVFGNRTYVNRESDVSFGKVLNQAFKFGAEKPEYALIGVRTDYNTPKTWYYDDHMSYGGCKVEEHKNEMRAFASGLFSNNADINFKEEVSEKFEDESTTSFNKRHLVKIVSEKKQSDTYKVNVANVSYKGILLPASEYDVYYTPESRTIQLNVPDYLTENWNLTVLTENGVSFYNGTKVAQNGDGARYGLLVNNTNKSKQYTISVENGRINGTEPDESGTSTAQKKFFDSLEIEPIVPDDKVFSHWEPEGDYTIDGISGFKQYAKKLKNVLMPNGNVRLKPVFKNKVKTVEVKMYSPEVGKRTPFYTRDLNDKWLKANVEYKAPNGETLRSEEISVTWKKQQEMFDGTAIHYFDYYANYLADFQVQDASDGAFLLADRGELQIKLSMDDEPLQDIDGWYVYEYGDGYDPWNSNNDYQPITQRIVYYTQYYRSEKAPIRNSIPSQISVEPGTTKAELIKLLPESVNVEIADIIYGSGEERPETTHSPVEWDTSSLPETVSEESFTIQGTYKTEDVGFELKSGDVIRPTLIVDPITQQQSQVPQVTVDGTRVTVIDGKAKLALNKKIKLATSMEGATVHYKLDDNEYQECTSDTEIEILGEKDKIITHTIEAYAEANGERSDKLNLTLEVDNATSYSVKILDNNGIEYRFADGGGEYKLGDKVSVDVYKKYMKNPYTTSGAIEDVYDPRKIATAWSAKGIVLNEYQLKNHAFDFEMPNSNVIITIDSFRNREEYYSVTIVDSVGNVYERAIGAGQYRESKDTVTIDSTKYTLITVDDDGKATEEEIKVEDNVVSEWSAEGIELTDEQKKASKFEFVMPPNDVVIKVESTRPLVKTIYLSSIYPVAGKKLPDKLEILSATDINGNPIEKKDIWMETKLGTDSGYDKNWVDMNTQQELALDALAEKGHTYWTVFNVQPTVSGETVTLDDYEMFMDGEKVESSFLFGPHTITVERVAMQDELLAVDLPESATYYSMSDAKEKLPKEVNVRTKYGTTDKAEITWDGAEQLDSNLAYGDFTLTAKLNLPEFVDDPKSIGTKEVTIKVRKHIDNVKLTAPGIFPPRQGATLPNNANISNQYADATTVLRNFKVLNKDKTDVTGQITQAGEEYTITASIVPKTDYAALSDNTVFTINDNAMEVIGKTENEDSDKSEVYEVAYTFVADPMKIYTVITNGTNGTTTIQRSNGMTVELYTDSTDFYKWTAEAVYATTETVTEGEGENAVTKEIKVEHRHHINPFEDGKEYLAETKFTMPLLVDDSARLEVTANYAHGITSYDRDTKNANIVSDKAYDGIKVIFAAYDKSDRLVSVGIADADLAKGENIVTAPEDFKVDDGEILKIAVWNNMEDLMPIFGAFEQMYEKKTE